MRDVLSELGQELDQCKGTRHMVGGGTMGGLTFGGRVTTAMRQLAQAGMPWVVILQVVPIILRDFAAGKSLSQIVADIIAAFTAGRLTAAGIEGAFIPDTATLAGGPAQPAPAGMAAPAATSGPGSPVGFPNPVGSQAAQGDPTVPAPGELPATNAGPVNPGGKRK